MLFEPTGARSHLLVFLGGCALACAVSGCGGKNKKADEKTMATPSKVPKVDETLCDTGGKQVTTYDLNKDGKPDVWKLYKEVEEGGARLQVLSCKQIDFDHDSKKDYVVAYDNRGAKLFEKFDRDFDGRFDIFYQYDAKSGQVADAQFESGFDGRYDIQKVYKEGKLSSIRSDRNGDGKPDVWEQYVDERLVAILYDDDYDSKVDRREVVKVEEKKPQKVQDDGPGEPGPDDSAASDSGEAGQDGRTPDDKDAADKPPAPAAKKPKKPAAKKK